MNASRIRLLLAAVLAAIAATAIGSAVAPALNVRATPKTITAAGVGGVTLGRSHGSLHAAGLVGRIHRGCELGGPQTRGAKLLAPLKGSVDYTLTSPRKVTEIFITGGATARGVGIGASPAKIKQAFPKVVADHSTDKTFLFTLYSVPKSGGGKLAFAVDTKTKKVTSIGIPYIAVCD